MRVKSRPHSQFSTLLVLSRMTSTFAFNQVKMEAKIENSWKKVLETEFNQPYFSELRNFVRESYASSTCYPPAHLLFNAFNQCPFSAVKVVILGQDPYINPGQAHGLSFSVPKGVALPPSLLNIYKEVFADNTHKIPKHGDLTRWAEQGVLLLNATLSVEAGKSASHQGQGWERFTDAVIQKLSDDRDALVFLLWGSYAGKKAGLVDSAKHLVLKAPHPSPLSAYRGFFGCGHFHKANEWLRAKNLSPIDWADL